MKREAAPAAADIEHPEPRRQAELGRDMGHLVELGLLDRVGEIGEIAAAILEVGVEEEAVEVVADVVMVGDVVARAPAPVELARANGGACRPSSGICSVPRCPPICGCRG